MVNKTLDHLSHVEDLLFTEGKKGQEYLDHFFDRLPEADIRLKWDGSPSILFGYDEGERFFVSTKSNYFRKDGPIRLYSADDILQYHADASDDLRMKLFYALNLLQNGAWMHRLYHADILFSVSDIAVKSDTVEFSTNTLTYVVDKDSDFADGILPLTPYLGVVVHSYYDKEGNPQPAGIDCTDGNVFYAPTRIDPVPLLTDEDRMEIVASQLCIEDVDDRHLVYAPELKLFANYCVRYAVIPDVWSFIRFVYDRYTDKMLSYKTSQFQAKKMLETEEFTEHMAQNMKYYSNLFQSYRAYQNVKRLWLEALCEEYNGVTCKINNEPALHEGVVVTFEDRTVKMVDRDTFSRANFQRFHD